MIFIGLDPGANGGLAVIDRDRSFAYKLADLTDLELVESLQELAVAANQNGGAFAMLEAVHAMPRQGVASTFKFGVAYGAARMALVAAGVPFETVTPAKWQQALGCRSGGDKRVTRSRAQELFPGVKVTHAVADALLIAEYARRSHGRTS